MRKTCGLYGLAECPAGDVRLEGVPVFRHGSFVGQPDREIRSISWGRAKTANPISIMQGVS
jgi:hypothetical protein